MRSSMPWALTIHINLNMTFYTHVEHSPSKTNKGLMATGTENTLHK